MKKKDENIPLQLLETLGDFTSKENWDKFFSLRGAGDSFEWYAEWPSLRDPLLSELSSVPSAASTDAISRTPQLLVPGCGSSRVSEYLYDAGFQQITNIDFSKVVVSDMLRRYVRSRPEMRWRVMDMTDMQFSDESFDVVLDKGGLDALMEPEVGSELGSKYVKEVKRVLKSEGKYVCLTLAESHVLGLLFNLFRFGWKTSIKVIPNKTANKPTFQTFMVVFLKESLFMVNMIGSPFDQSSVACSTEQAQALVDAIKSENQIREDYSNTDFIYSLRDLALGAQGNLQELQEGRRFQLILGVQGESLYSYNAVILDAHQKVGSFSYNCGVFIVPKTRAREWLFSSVDGQWQIVESSKAARIIMVFLDSSHSNAKVEAIQKDLSPLVKNLAPAKDYGNYQIPFMMANDGVKQKKIIYQVTSKITGPMIVEDVVYEESVADGNNNDHFPLEYTTFRRLVFERSSGLVQSEALLILDPKRNSVEQDRRQTFLSSNSRKKGSRKKNDPSMSSDGSKCSLKVDHSTMASSYHRGIISGFSLVVSALRNAASMREKVGVIVVGLGAGLFPTFLHMCLPFLDIEVVELDPVILELAKGYFGFKEDERLKVHIDDGIKFIQKAYDQESEDGKDFDHLKILVVDADSSDLRYGLTCPPADFVEEHFLSLVKNFLSVRGLFVINLVSRSSSIRQTVISRLKSTFDHVFSMELEEDVNVVLFASTMNTCFEEDRQLAEAVEQLKNLLKIPLPSIVAQSKTIRRL